MPKIYRHMEANPAVLVKLTPTGKAMLDQFLEESGISIGPSAGYYDEKGRARISFWLLLHLFGHYNGHRYEIEDLWVLTKAEDPKDEPGQRARLPSRWDYLRARLHNHWNFWRARLGF